MPKLADGLPWGRGRVGDGRAVGAVLRGFDTVPYNLMGELGLRRPLVAGRAGDLSELEGEEPEPLE